MFKINYQDLPDDLKALHEEQDNLRQTLLKRFTDGCIQAQNKLAQEVLDNGESLEDYWWYETQWFEGTVWHYKCWREKK